MVAHDGTPESVRQTNILTDVFLGRVNPDRAEGSGVMGRGGARRGLWRLRWLAVLAALAMTAASCGGSAFEAGPLGAVEVVPGEAIQIRSMQVLTGLGDLGTPIQRGAAFAVADYGPIHGHEVSMGDEPRLAVYR